MNLDHITLIVHEPGESQGESERATPYLRVRFTDGSDITIKDNELAMKLLLARIEMIS